MCIWDNADPSLKDTITWYNSEVPQEVEHLHGSDTIFALR